MNVKKAFLIVLHHKIEDKAKNIWNVWTLKYVKIIHSMKNIILIVQKVFVWILVRHNIHYQNIHNLIKHVLNVVIVTDSIKSMNQRLLNLATITIV